MLGACSRLRRRGTGRAGALSRRGRASRTPGGRNTSSCPDLQKQGENECRVISLVL